MVLQMLMGAEKGMGARALKSAGVLWAQHCVRDGMRCRAGGEARGLQYTKMASARHCYSQAVDQTAGWRTMHRGMRGEQHW
jgi:hypothetical protein